jgi:hypothetical protein
LGKCCWKNWPNFLVATAVFLTDFALIDRKTAIFFWRMQKNIYQVSQRGPIGIYGHTMFFANSIWHTRLFHLKQKSQKTFANGESFALKRL